jgi:hypothetical protein
MRDPRLTASERMVLLAAEKLADDDDRVVLDDETLSLLQHPEGVLGYDEDGDSS